MRSLSELLTEVELHGRSWCYSQIGEDTCVSLPPLDGVVFHTVIHGSIRLTCREDTVELAAGDAVFMLSGSSHALRSQRSATGVTHDFLRDEREVDAPPTFTFSGSGAIAARVLSGRFRATWPAEIDPATLPPLLRLAADGPAAVIFQPAALSRVAFGIGSAALLTRLVSAMLAAELRNQADFTRRYDPEVGDPIAAALTLIKAAPSEDWTVEKLARAVGMGRSSFAEQFARRIGRTPMATLTAQRMDKAAALIREGKLRIANISEMSGYESEAAFSRRFARHFGISPADMRAQASARGPKTLGDAAAARLFFSAAAMPPAHRPAGGEASVSRTEVQPRFQPTGLLRRAKAGQG